MWYAEHALVLTEQAALEAITYDGANDKGIDLFVVDDENERVVIAQGKYKQKGDYRPKEGELLTLTKSTDWFEDIEALRKEGRADLVAAAEEYALALAKGYSVEYQYVFMGQATKELTDREAMENRQGADSEPLRRITIVDLDLLQSIHETRDIRVPEATLSLAPGKNFTQHGQYGEALVATVSGKDFRLLYDRFHDALFARNVRLFLGTRKGGVNAGIADTLASAEQRGFFWAYNNGLTVVCRDFDLAPDGSAVTLKDFSIVNGCQSTVSIWHAGAPADEVDILVRFIAAPEGIVDDVIYFTNSQTPIKRWELKAQSKVQKRLQQAMADEPNPYYYALRRGEVRTLEPKARGRFTRDGRFHSIQHDVLAQYLGAFRGLPYVAYKDKGRLFGEHYDSVFPQDITVDEALLAWRCAEAAYEQVQRNLVAALNEGRELEATMLKRGGVIFTVGVMALLLQQRNGANYLSHVDRSFVTSKKTLERLSAYARVSVVLYQQVTRAMLSGSGLSGLAAVLRTQDSYPLLRQGIQEEWEIRSIEREWVAALPSFGG